MPQLAAVCGRKEAEVRDHKLGDGVSTQNLPRDLTASRSTMDQHLPQSLLSTSLHRVPQVNNGASGCHLEAPNLLSSPYTPPPTHTHTACSLLPRSVSLLSSTVQDANNSPPALLSQPLPTLQASSYPHVYDHQQPC